MHAVKSGGESSIALITLYVMCSELVSMTLQLKTIDEWPSSKQGGHRVDAVLTRSLASAH